MTAQDRAALAAQRKALIVETLEDSRLCRRQGARGDLVKPAGYTWHPLDSLSAHAVADLVAEASGGSDTTAVYEISDSDSFTIASEHELPDFFPDSFDGGNLIWENSDAGDVLALEPGESVTFGGGAAPAFTFYRVQ